MWKGMFRSSKLYYGKADTEARPAQEASLTDEESKKRKLNTESRRALKAAEVSEFVRRYARKARHGLDPNDRSYDHRLEQRLKSMDPVELDRLLRDDEP